MIFVIYTVVFVINVSYILHKQRQIQTQTQYNLIT